MPQSPKPLRYISREALKTMSSVPVMVTSLAPGSFTSSQQLAVSPPLLHQDALYVLTTHHFAPSSLIYYYFFLILASPLPSSFAIGSFADLFQSNRASPAWSDQPHWIWEVMV